MSRKKGGEARIVRSPKIKDWGRVAKKKEKFPEKGLKPGGEPGKTNFSWVKKSGKN